MKGVEKAAGEEISSV